MMDDRSPGRGVAFCAVTVTYEVSQFTRTAQSICEVPLLTARLYDASKEQGIVEKQIIPAREGGIRPVLAGEASFLGQ